MRRQSRFATALEGHGPPPPPVWNGLDPSEGMYEVDDFGASTRERARAARAARERRRFAHAFNPGPRDPTSRKV